MNRKPARHLRLHDRNGADSFSCAPDCPILRRPWRRGHHLERRISAPGRPGSSWSVATARKPARRPVIEQAPAAERREHWWPGAVAIIVTAGLHVALPARYRVQPAWVVPVASLLAVLTAGDPGRIDRQKTWLRIVTGIVIALRWSSSRAPESSCPLPSTLSHGPRPYLGPFSPAPQDTRAREGAKGRGLLTVQAAITCGSARIRVPLCRANLPTRRLHSPPWAGTAMEEFLAAVLARAACLLAGALIGRLIRAFLAMPSPARP